MNNVNKLIDSFYNEYKQSQNLLNEGLDHLAYLTSKKEQKKGRVKIHQAKRKLIELCKLSVLINKYPSTDIRKATKELKHKINT